MLSLRYMLVSAILLPFYPKPPIPISKILKIALVFSLCNVALMYLSLQLGLDAGLGVIIQQLSVPFVLILSVFIFKEKTQLIQ